MCIGDRLFFSKKKLEVLQLAFRRLSILKCGNSVRKDYPVGKHVLSKDATRLLACLILDRQFHGITSSAPRTDCKIFPQVILQD